MYFKTIFTCFNLWHLMLNQCKNSHAWMTVDWSLLGFLGAVGNIKAGCQRLPCLGLKNKGPVRFVLSWKSDFLLIAFCVIDLKKWISVIGKFLRFKMLEVLFCISIWVYIIDFFFLNYFGFSPSIKKAMCSLKKINTSTKWQKNRTCVFALRSTRSCEKMTLKNESKKKHSGRFQF